MKLMGGFQLVGRYVIAESLTDGLFAGLLVAATKDTITLNKSVEILWIDYMPSVQYIAVHGPLGRIFLTTPKDGLILGDVSRIVGCSQKARTVFEKGKSHVRLDQKDLSHCMRCRAAGVLLH